MQSQLEQHIEAYDGKAVTLLSQAMQACRGHPGCLDDVVGLCFDARPLISEGATWILKAEVENGTTVPPHLVARIAGDLDRLSSWQAHLHLCQSFDHLACNAEQTAEFFAWADKLRTHARPFLRAWSLHVLVKISLEFEGFRQAAERALIAGENDQAASVRARARKLRDLVGSKP
ncbi:hypothetical protein ACERZ8_14000 [Tateyamaria armeniaca]|uniref:Uncharacterized protein n=1 Tax=Tateyamaria armeniaca TaxID=2518930 RepID=A0ABW8UZ25_9RHOB